MEEENLIILRNISKCSKTKKEDGCKESYDDNKNTYTSAPIGKNIYIFIKQKRENKNLLKEIFWFNDLDSKKTFRSSSCIPKLNQN